jgi:hypothetical protein
MIPFPIPHRLLTTPIELVKIQQQKHQQLLHTTHETGKRTSPSASASASARAIALHIYRTGGIRALYRGLSATIWRDVGGYGLYFYGVRPSSQAPNHAKNQNSNSTKARCASSRPHTYTQPPQCSSSTIH